MAPNDKMFDIFELTQLIADHLSQHDLALCFLVNKSFLNTFTPHLWHSITIHLNDSTPKFQNLEGRAGLLRNGHHIRVLRAYDPLALEPFVKSGFTCTNLVSLDVAHRVDRFTGKVATSRTLAMLSKGRRRGSIGDGQRQGSIPAMCGFAPSSTGFGVFGASASETAGSLPNGNRARSHAELQNDVEIYLVSILERNPRLEFLVVPSRCLDCQSIIKVAGESLLLLKEFYSEDDLWQQGSGTFFSLRKQSMWTTTLSGAVRVNYDALERIRLTDRDFTHLEMAHGRPSQVIQILMRAPPLKHIMLKREGGARIAYASDDNAVKDAFLRHAPTLEHLSTDRYHVQQESRAVQRGVLRQLGQLTNLRKLRLGQYGRDWDMPVYSRLEIRGIRTMAVDAYFDHNCLELSLEGGLDELVGLKQLEELLVHQMAHRIGLAEVQWMVENWPKLRTIKGLTYQDCDHEVPGSILDVLATLDSDDRLFTVSMLFMFTTRRCFTPSLSSSTSSISMPSVSPHIDV
ncbi:MAG: hypothetical protein JOS17DRAFT_817638 [Linnemannia elongata]|nr:MAG: hypothetical protein JOS17DRAFT_817638 [Linnemannia elongata]